MELKDKLEKFAERIANLKDTIQTEEATKHSLVLPFFQILGYDIFDPNVVVPEFTADVGIKKGEKVDYAIMHDGNPFVIVEAKNHTENLDKHTGQLFRYFTTVSAKFAILTNGIEYRFYSDIDNTNKMDEKPFLVIDLENLLSRDVKALERFSKENLNIDEILEMASKQRNVIAVKKVFEAQSKEPSDDFVRFFAKSIEPNCILTANKLEEFRAYIKSALSEVITDLAAKKINSLKSDFNARINEENSQNEIAEKDEDGIVTTAEELQGFYIVKSLLCDKISLDRIYPRDTKSYFGILLDDNNRKWIARLHFNSSKKYLGIHEIEKQETKYPLEKIEDIYNFKEQLLKTLERLQGQE
ncbi:MAG: type I restriction endonuclease [Campylobacter sp.]|uniref:type I restriction endonuclease n=1 Tax=Campylobacter TaxID=194 RepID=UPI0026E0CCE0|nr:MULTISPECIES: type I restriction endonuclease [Campylobacter]MCI7247878.1 type I restriction endonuclease [Campylobacter sp.]MDO2408353.1 type I restriction endonuclease [Campylobacter magnus]